MKKLMIYALLTSGLIPATYLLIIAINFISIYISEANSEVNNIPLITSLVSGVLGYIGLLLLFRGLHYTNKTLKATLLLLGLVGYTLFFKFASNSNIWSKIVYAKEPFEWFLFFWPLIVSIAFLLLMIFDALKQRKSGRI